ncbi:hypothetical protein AB0J35_59360 [Nonomuraea angiospora]|uniref:hypothetical protein n=1 Tax=Nonomuraea angiospora TaxID=46172 RepID=UPI00343682D9
MGASVPAAIPQPPADPGDPPPGSAAGSMGTAVERFLGSLRAATTRGNYARTLARLIAVTGPEHPVAGLTPGRLRRHHGGLGQRRGRHLEPAPVGPGLRSGFSISPI